VVDAVFSHTENYRRHDLICNATRAVQQNTKNHLMPGFHHSICRSSVDVSPFCRRKISLFCKNYVRIFHSVTAVNNKKIRSGNGSGVRKGQQLTGTAKQQWKNGNGMVETEH